MLISPSRMSYLVGIDISTTATKALIMDESGRVVAVGRSEYSAASPRPHWSEQDPELWWKGTVAAVRRALGRAGITGAEVSGIGLTGQMHGLVLLDDTGMVLRPAILWNDQRTEPECDEIRTAVGSKRLIEITGNDALTGFTAPKLLWVRNHEPDVYARIAHVLLPKDYVRYRLSGTLAVDRAGGSGTILFDLAQRDWSDEVVHDLGIPRHWLPPTFEGTDVTSLIDQPAAEATGLTAATPIVAGGGDQAANGVGVGAVEEGIAAMSLGTSGVVFAATSRPLIEPEGRLHAFCHALPAMWHLMGVMLSAAGSLRWLRDAVAPDASFDELVDAAAAIPAASNGLVFLPYLSGERTPYPDPKARAAFVGLTARHDLAHMTRAVMEGVAFGLRDVVELMTGLVDITDLRISGGGATGTIWPQIIADVLGRPITMVGTTEAAAHGAAMLAGAGVGVFDSVAQACLAGVSLRDVIEPVGATAPTYEAAYAVYRGLYPVLRDSFTRLGELDR